MSCPIIIRRHEGVQSYLVLDDNPRELLRHVGFAEPLSVRPWLGSTDPLDALEEWAEMLAEDPYSYVITDSESWDYCLASSLWDDVPMWPQRSGDLVPKPIAPD